MMNKNERETMANLQAALSAAEAKLINAQFEAAAAATNAKAQIEALNKEVSQHKSYAEMYNRNCDKATNELEAAHSLLDGLPQSPPRETEAKESYNVKQVPLATRLANWVARVAFCDAFAKAGMK